MVITLNNYSSLFIKLMKKQDLVSNNKVLLVISCELNLTNKTKYLSWSL